MCVNSRCWDLGSSLHNKKKNDCLHSMKKRYITVTLVAFFAFGSPDCDGGSRGGQGCGNTMPDLSDLVPFHSGQVENFYLLVIGHVQMYK